MLIEKIRNGLSKTRNKLQEAFLSVGIFFDKDFEKSVPRLEEILLSSDFGIKATDKIIKRLRERRAECRAKELLIPLLSQILIDILNKAEKKRGEIFPPLTILTVGVNGTGKTTSLAKLAKVFKDRGEKVLLVASDTYRAAGVEQLFLWGKRVGVDVLKSQTGQDPASVAFDAIESALSKGYTAVLIDTAGRIHTKKNLMEELKKIKNVLSKKREDLPQEIFLILDATTGQNALSQVQIFSDTIDVTGIILTKIDGTAKGGIVLAIALELGIPIRYVGIGEGVDDLIMFEPNLFVQSLLEGIALK